MGADLLIACVVTDKDATLNWDAVDAALAAVSDQEIQLAVEYANGDLNDTIEKDRAEARQKFDDLRKVIEDPDGREVTILTVRDAWVHVAGGMSWGDSPSDAFDTFNFVNWFPQVLRAVGFDG